MRIIFITRSWHGIGGMQRLSKDLWRGISETYGDEAMLLHPYKEGITWLLPFAFRAFFRGMCADHIHLGDASLAPLGVLIKRFSKARVTVTLCGLDTFYSACWYQWLLRHSLPRLDHIVCISGVLRDRAIKIGVSEDRITVIPCGVWPEDVRAISSHKKSDHPVIVTVGRLIPRKGVLWFLENVLPELLKKMPTVEYRIIGDGPDIAAIRSVLLEKKLSHAVCIFSSASDAKRDHLLLSSNLMLVPNISVLGNGEGFGIVCIEAAVRGIPVVAARIEGLRDSVIEGKTGHFFESGNAQDCIAIIEEMMKQPLSTDVIRKTAIETYDWHTLFQRYDAIFSAMK